MTIGNSAFCLFLYLLVYIFEASYSTVVTSLTEKIGRSIRTREINGVSLSVKSRPIRTREIGGVSLSDVLYVK